MYPMSKGESSAGKRAFLSDGSRAVLMGLSQRIMRQKNPTPPPPLCLLHDLRRPSVLSALRPPLAFPLPSPVSPFLASVCSMRCPPPSSRFSSPVSRLPSPLFPKGAGRRWVVGASAQSPNPFHPLAFSLSTLRATPLSVLCVVLCPPLVFNPPFIPKSAQSVIQTKGWPQIG